MIINSKSIVNVEKYISEFREGEKFYIGIKNVENYHNELGIYIDINKLEDGCTFVPRPIKNVTTYNSNGKIKIDKSIIEDRTFEREYHIIDFHGEDHYGTCFQTRKCYKRDIILPPEVELNYNNGMIISPLLVCRKENNDRIKHIINMFLEIFGVCETLNEEYSSKQAIEVKRLQWTVLPKGEYPWKKAKEYIGLILNNTNKKHRGIINRRHEVITNNVPDFMAIGEQGFFGYIIYGFEKKNIFIFESNKINNATYVFKGNWKKASMLSKAEILNGYVYENRVIHNKSWNKSIENIINVI